MRIQNSSSLFTMQCVCVLRSHIVTFSFSMQQISLLFLLCCWLCPQVNPTIRIFPHFYSLVVTFHSLFVVTFLSFCLFSLIFITFLLFVILFFRQACPILLPLLFLIIPWNIFLLQKLFPIHLWPWLAPKYKSELWPLGELTKKICGQSWNLAPNCFPSKLPKTKGAIELSSKCHKMGGTIYHQ